MSAVILGKWKRKRTYSILVQLSECLTTISKQPVNTFFFELYTRSKIYRWLRLRETLRYPFKSISTGHRLCAPFETKLFRTGQFTNDLIHTKHSRSLANVRFSRTCIPPKVFAPGREQQSKSERICPERLQVRSWVARNKIWCDLYLPDLARPRQPHPEVVTHAAVLFHVQCCSGQGSVIKSDAS
jgi:hypothetical protein